MRYELIQLVPSGDVLAIKHLSDGRTLCTHPLHYTEQDLPLDEFEYDNEFLSYGEDMHTTVPYSGEYTVIRSA